jgi:glycosyltransferase involved in cell wall biosynthesis
MGSIRVLELVAGLAVGDQVGGAELFGIQVARHLDRTSFVPAVVGLWRYGSPSEQAWQRRLRQEGIYTRLLADAPTRLLPDLGRAFARLWAIVSSFRPDIINSYSERTDLCNVLIHLFHPLHPRAVRTMQTEQQWQDRPWLGATMSQLVFPFACDAEMSVSQEVQRVLDRRPIARLIRKRSILRHSGIDAALFADRESAAGEHCAALLRVGDGRRIGIVARLTPQKGHRDLLEALSIVCHDQPVHLMVAGSGPLEHDLKALAEQLGIADYVHFLGSREDVHEILPCFEILVLPSLWEGFPHILLEAMALEVPVIATDVSGSRELVKTGETGMLVPPADPPALARAILQMLGDPAEMRRMARQAKQLASHFTMQNAASYYGQVYQRLAGRSSPVS